MNGVRFVHLFALLPQQGDAGVFTCVATNAGGSARQDVHLSINMRPAFKELPGDVTLNKGQSLALSCHAQGTPPPLISWTFNNSPYLGNIFILYGEPKDCVMLLSHVLCFTGAVVDEAGRSSVLIDNVTLSNAGTYVCIAENLVGAIRALSFVRIRGETSART